MASWFAIDRFRPREDTDRARCPNAHVIIGANLADGGQCRACSAARSMVRAAGDRVLPGDREAWADDLYAELMGEPEPS